MKKSLISVLISIILSFPAFADRIETDNVTFNKNVNIVSNVNLRANGQITMVDGGIISTNTYTPENIMMHPVFVIPLSGWSEFELKADTNNFNGATICYWLESLGNSYTAWTNYAHADLNAKIFYCNPDTTNNARSWNLLNITNTLTQAIGVNGNYQNTVIAIPSFTLKDGSTNTWMYKSNDKVIWVYRRRTASYGETNSLGRAIWNPIVPVEYRRNFITP